MTEKSVLPPLEVEAYLSTTLEKAPVNGDCFEQSPRPCSFDQRGLRARVLGGYQVIIKRSTKRITLLRFLVAKLLYSDEGLSLEEYLTVYHLFYDLSEVTEPHFLAKHQENLERVFKLLQAMKDVKVFPVQVREGQQAVLENLLGRFLPTPREYSGLAGQRDLRKSFRLVLNDTLVPQKLPAPRYIGVGYKDKGTRRNTAIDGSQSWVEVGSYFANLEREAEDSSDSFDLEIDGPEGSPG